MTIIKTCLWFAFEWVVNAVVMIIVCALIAALLVVVFGGAVWVIDMAMRGVYVPLAVSALLIIAIASYPRD